MKTCKHCNGFIPGSHTHCPNCGERVEYKKKQLGKIISTIAVTSASMILMACYGAPPCRTKQCERERAALALLPLITPDTESYTATENSTSTNTETNTNTYTSTDSNAATETNTNTSICTSTNNTQRSQSIVPCTEEEAKNE